MSAEDVSTLRAAYEEFPHGLEKILAKKVRWREPKVDGLWVSGGYRGAKQVSREVLEPIPSLFEQFSVEAEEFIDAGKRVLVTGRYRLRGRGHNLDVVTPFVHVWKMKKGRARRFRDYTESERWLTTLREPATITTP